MQITHITRNSSTKVNKFLEIKVMEGKVGGKGANIRLYRKLTPKQ